MAGLWFWLLLFAFSLSVKTASSQSIWLDRGIDRAIWLEVQKPDFPTNPRLAEAFNPEPEHTFTTSLLFLSASWRVSELLVLRGEIPFASWGYKDYAFVYFATTYNNPTGVPDTAVFSGFSEEKFGNPLLGVQLGGPAFPLSGEFALRFPLIQSESMQKIGANWAAPFGALTDYDRFEAFLQDMWSFNAAANLKHTGPAGLFLRLRTGLTFLVPTKDYLENDLYIDYASQAGYQFFRIELLAGFSGRYLVTEKSLDFGARTIHQLGVSANYEVGHFIPGAHFRVPLDDDLQRDLDFVFGLNLGYRLP
ncbi:MAG: hypothetical protein L0Z48_08275 [candidate division Zixibacteria bacterium]|nr:hypothetical protein [candidate division Zixibacteria bacterium]